jgi:hypothetical protein
MRLRSQTLDELVAHGVNRQFAGILAAPKSFHEDLDIIIGRTDWDYFVPSDVTDVVPLWDVNADSFVRWKRNHATEYVWLLHDDPSWTLIAKTEQGIMAKLWQNWIEFQDSDDDKARQFAEAINFRYCDEGLRLLATDYDGFVNWILDLPDKEA